jgi:hypothetical protein
MSENEQTTEITAEHQLEDFQRRYQLMKGKIEAIAIMGAVSGEPAISLGITISSRMCLRSQIIGQHGPIMELVCEPDADDVAEVPAL